MRTHYDNLQVTQNADPEVIKGAYQRLAKKYHPDKAPNETDRVRFEKIMKVINEAYRVLSDENLRREHDADIAESAGEQDESEHVAAVNHSQQAIAYNNETNNSWGWTVAAALFAVFITLRLLTPQTDDSPDNGELSERHQLIVEVSNSANQNLPMFLDEITRLDSTIPIRGDTLRYNYTIIGAKKSQINVTDFVNSMHKRGITNKACSTVPTLIKQGVNLEYAYYGEDGILFAVLQVKPNQCRDIENAAQQRSIAKPSPIQQVQPGTSAVNYDHKYMRVISRANNELKVFNKVSPQIRSITVTDIGKKTCGNNDADENHYYQCKATTRLNGAFKQRYRCVDQLPQTNSTLCVVSYRY